MMLNIRGPSKGTRKAGDFLAEKDQTHFYRVAHLGGHKEGKTIIIITSSRHTHNGVQYQNYILIITVYTHLRQAKEDPVPPNQISFAGPIIPTSILMNFKGAFISRWLQLAAGN